MIIGISADTHFGYPRFFEDSFKQGKEAFRKICEKSDVVILAGDIFDMKVPKFEVLGRVMEILEFGKEKKWPVTGEKGEFPVVAIHGTHERRSKESINSIQILEKSGFITNAHDKTVVFEKNSEKVAITGFGGVPDEYVISVLEEKKFGEKKLTPVKGAFNIFVLHQTISDIVPLAKGAKMEDLPAGFDLYVCGHIHKKRVEKIGTKLLIIPGSTVVTQLKRDEIERKGFYLFDTKTKEPQFVEIETRPYIFKEIKIEAADSEKVKKACRTVIDGILSNNYKTKPIIKLILTGSIKEGLKRENIVLTDILGEYQENAFLEIENNLDSRGLRERVEVFRKMYDEKKSVREIGTEILKGKIGGKIKNVEELFEKLSDSKNIDELVRKDGID